MRIALGAALTAGALGAFGYIGAWELHAHRTGSALTHEEQAAVGRGRAVERPGGQAGSDGAACTKSAPRDGQLAGLLEIPRIHLTAPVEQGSKDAVLAVAVGHFSSSVWPGAKGTAALLAHDVSYFVNLGSLKPGDAVVYETPCSAEHFVVTRSQVVAEGTPIPDTAAPSLVLDTCYPPDALFFTKERLLVWAKERRGAGHEIAYQHDHVAGHGAGVLASAPGRFSYRVAAPPALVAEGLTLEGNEVPMGTMTLAGSTWRAWAQSPGPLALEGAALEAYFGGLHAAAQEQTAWWRAISRPGLAIPAPLHGASSGSYEAPLDVKIVSRNHRASEVVLTTVLALRGGSAAGTYVEKVTESVRGSKVALSDWALHAGGA